MAKGEKIVAIGTVTAQRNEDGVEFTISAEADTKEHLEKAFEIVSEALLGSVPAEESKPSKKSGKSVAVNWPGASGLAWGKNKKNLPT